MRYSLFCFVITVVFFTPAQSQTVEIDGQARITQMPADNNSRQVVVRQPDGILGIQQAEQLTTPFDTNPNLASDIELARFLCECNNLSPLLIQRFLNNGYTPDDLLNAGVPWSDIQNGLPIVDGDGNKYTPIQIGNQVWLKESLKTTSYNDGTPIGDGNNVDEWVDAGDNDWDVFAWYEFDQVTYGDTYGALYNWFVVSPVDNGNKNVCPVGWHVPTLAEAEALVISLSPNAGSKLKTAGTQFWDAPNSGANNSSGYSARGSGQINPDGSSSSIRSTMRYWTSESASATTAFNQTISANSESVSSGVVSKAHGYAIRCLRD